MMRTAQIPRKTWREIKLRQIRHWRRARRLRDLWDRLDADEFLDQLWESQYHMGMKFSDDAIIVLRAADPSLVERLATESVYVQRRMNAHKICPDCHGWMENHDPRCERGMFMRWELEMPQQRVSP